MITTGATGQSWRASITPWGALEPWDDGAVLNWFVAADDRWHVPADEPAVRQRRLEGTAVTETRVRVPTGDVVQRICTVADAGGLTIIEVENDSTLPVAVAFDRRDVLTERPIVDVPIEGIDLPPDSFALPLGHKATVRIALAHDRPRSGPLPARLPGHLQVVRGWLAITERASRFVLPEGDAGSVLATAVTAERCELALGSIPRADDDPAGFAVALGELVRMGEQPDPWMPELVDAVSALGPVRGWHADVALDAAGRVLDAAGERRGRRDLARIMARRTREPRPIESPSGVLGIPWLESLLSSGGSLLPSGVPTAWLGQSVDVYGVPTASGASVSFALRWHGERPAVLWEQTGGAIELSAPVLAPGWSSAEQTGETLWPVPPNSAAARPLTDDDSPIDVGSSSDDDAVIDPEAAPVVESTVDDEPGSFS